jgi:hypothetical protein
MHCGRALWAFYTFQWSIGAHVIEANVACFCHRPEGNDHSLGHAMSQSALVEGWPASLEAAMEDTMVIYTWLLISFFAGMMIVFVSNCLCVACEEKTIKEE